MKFKLEHVIRFRCLLPQLRTNNNFTLDTANKIFIKEEFNQEKKYLSKSDYEYFFLYKSECALHDLFLRYLADLTKNFYTTAEKMNFTSSADASKVKQIPVSCHI